MQNKHILNIGYPKCGTTWIWNQLAEQDWFSSPLSKENHDLCYGKISVNDYYNCYKDFNITGNFCPFNFSLDRCAINLLSRIESVVVTMIFRNPFELYLSFYNFSGAYKKYRYHEFVKIYTDQKWFSNFGKIIDRWKFYFPKNRFFVFLYDDLKTNPELFFKNYCNHLSMPTVGKIKNELVNVTKYQESIDTSIDNNLTDIINTEIDQLQQKITYDIQHWKKHYHD